MGKNWPVEKREQIADWLFSSDVDEKGNPKGIGLSIWRFYLAAGTTEQGEASCIPSPWRRGESFLSPDGKWDWTKYEGQRWFLKAAQKRGVEKFLAFTIAPPVEYAKNGKGFGTKGVSNFNILPGKEKDYSAYWANVLQYFKQEDGLEFEYFSPFNEPQWDWEKGSQEGTPAKNEELYEYVKFLSEEFVRLKLKTARDSKLMWALGNYSRFVRPGMLRVQAELTNETGIDPNQEKIMVSAYSLPDKKNLVIVLVNIEPVRQIINASIK